MLRASRRVVPSIMRPRQPQQWRPLQSTHHRFLSTWDHKREKPPQAPRVTSFHRKETGATASTTTPLGGPFNAVEDAAPIASSVESTAGDATPVPLFEEALHPFHNNHSDLNFDVESNALRMGFPHYKNEYVDEPGDEIREELREEATLMAERVLCRIRRTMGEREANKVLRKLSSYTSNPRPTRHSVTKFFGSLEIMNHADHANEFAYLRAFLCGKDAEKAAMDTASLLHPDHPMYNDVCAVILVHCKRACATTLARVPNSTLPFVKRQLLRLLQAKGWEDMVSYAGLLHVPRDRNDSVNPIDNEWVALTLEDDLAEFHRDLDEASEMLATFRRGGGLTNHDVEKLLSVMVAYVKMAKAHRDILQLLVCEFQNTVKPSAADGSDPRPSQDKWMVPIVRFLSSGRANLAEIQATEGFDVDLVHHRHRTEAAIRLLLDARMRTSHIYIRGLDEEVLDRTLANKSDATRRALLTTALNLATVLDDRDFHAFYGRYVRHKLTWRSNFDTSVDIFLSDIAEGLPNQIPEASRQFLVDSLCQVHNDLTLEALNVCRLRVLNRGRLIRATATLTRVGDEHETVDEDERDAEDAAIALSDLPPSWDRRRTVFYHNLPPNTTVDTLRQTFQNIGHIERIWMFDEPRAELSPVIEPLPSDDADDGTNEDGSPKKAKRKSKKDGKAKTKDGDLEETESDAEATNDDVAAEDADDDSPKKAKRKAKKEGKAKTKDGAAEEALSDEDIAPEEKAVKTLHVVASERHSTTQCVVEFATEEGQKRALHPALKIFGVMVKGAEELRATFSTAPDTRSVVTIHSIPFCTQISHVRRHLQAALGADLKIDLGSNALPDLFVTKGTLELSFNSFEEAAVVVDRLNKYLEARPDPKYELPFVAKKKQKYEPTTTKTFVTNPLTKTLRAKREKDKAEDQARNTTPIVYLRYKDGVPQEDHRPFEVSWTPVPRRRPRPAL